MKKVFRFLLIFTCRLCSFFWSYSTSCKYKKIKRIFHTYWISSEFKSLGRHTSIGYPINLKGGKFITIGEKSTLNGYGVLTAWANQNDIVFKPQIIIGNNVSIGEGFHITAINRIEIKDNVLMGKRITITDNSHGRTSYDEVIIPPTKRIWFSKGVVIIEENVWIGDKVTILAGVIIGKNSIIGANSVVTKDVKENSVVGGNPARLIKKIV